VIEISVRPTLGVRPRYATGQDKDFAITIKMLNRYLQITNPKFIINYIIQNKTPNKFFIITRE
jgi:hypothetical protein